MISQSTITEKKCSFEKIITYLDGELPPQEEIDLERHFAGCRDCLTEFNLQKRMISALDCAFDNKTEIKLPENFAKVVATHAETSVKGLNSKRERFLALFFCLVLLLTVTAGLGGETNNIFSSLAKISEQTIAVLGFVAHLAYDIVFGITVVLRAVGNQPGFNSTVVLIFFVGVLIFLTVRFTRFVYGQNRS